MPCGARPACHLSCGSLEGWARAAYLSASVMVRCASLRCCMSTRLVDHCCRMRFFSMLMASISAEACSGRRGTGEGQGCPSRLFSSVYPNGLITHQQRDNRKLNGASGKPGIPSEPRAGAEGLGVPEAAGCCLADPSVFFLTVFILSMAFVKYTRAV